MRVDTNILFFPRRTPFGIRGKAKPKPSSKNPSMDDPKLIPTTMETMAGGDRDWAELPWDALSVIFEKIGAAGVITSAQSACRQWWRLAHDRRIWRRVEITKLDQRLDALYDLAKIAFAAVDRSAGGLVEFSIWNVGTDELLQHIAERNTHLKQLRLIFCEDLSDDVIIEACKSFPSLEELEISYCDWDDATFESIGCSCPNLKTLRMNGHGDVYGSPCNKQALSIAKNMRKLREIQLFENGLNEEGLHAILDGCLSLESLDIRHCFLINFDEKLKHRCKGLTSFRLPSDSLDDYQYVNEHLHGNDTSDYNDPFFEYDGYDYDGYDLDDFDGYDEGNLGDFDGYRGYCDFDRNGDGDGDCTCIAGLSGFGFDISSNLNSFIDMSDGHGHPSQPNYDSSPL